MTRIIESLDQIASAYDALFVDLWGCVHDGVRAFPAACAALERFRAGGGHVVLVTNAPRHRRSVAAQLVRFGVPESAYDDIATSGDSARVAMYAGAVGTKVWHLGDPSDQDFFDPPEILEHPLPIARVALEEAEGVVCTGLPDVHSDPATLRPELLSAKVRGLKLLCANPDIVVDRGARREWCAGAVAQLYTEMGGESLYFGKPHPPIYDLARRRLARLAGPAPVPDSRILCIGDGIATDVQGGIGEDLDVLFITGGLAAAETRTAPGGQPEPQALEAFLAQAQLSPGFAIGALR